MSVAVAGEGVAVEAVRTALADADEEVLTGLEALPDADLGVVVGLAGSDGFERANALAVEAGVPWLAVEVGGVGGHPLAEVTASVAGFGPEAGCHRCLGLRVAAATDPEPVDPSAPRADVRFAGALAGREATRALHGEAVAGSVVEVPGTRRTFLPVPDCPVCDAGRDRTLERGFRDVDLDDAVSRVDAAVDPRVGLVTAVGERESYPTPYYLATLAATDGFSDAAVGEAAAGVDADWDRAYVKAVGEALERYAAAVYRTDEFARGDVTDPVAPARFVRPDDAPADGDVAWVPGTDLHADESVHLPAEFVHFPPPAETHRPAITTGLGLGNSVDEALRAGLTEVIERDATMLAWYSTYDPLGLTVDDEHFRSLAARARSEDLTVTPVLVTQDVDVPVVTVAVHREGEWPRFAVGSAADLDAGRAATRAAAEALQNWMELRAMGPEAAAAESGAIGRYADFPEAARALVDPAATVPAATVGPEAPPTGAAAVDALLDRVDAAGLSAYAARLTTRDVARLGFEAVRVLVPAAQPLFVDEPYFGERARTVPADLGFESRLDRPFHPYP
ncbi:MAG: YcaO-like family protein [Halobacteriaceae archaeon]